MTTPSRPDPLPWVLGVLTVTTGLIDAVSVLGLGRIFTANMTGNIVFLGFAAAGVPGFSVARTVVSLVGVSVGALLGGRLGVAMAGVARRRWLLSVAVVEAGLCFVAAWVANGYDIGTLTPLPTLYALIILTAVAMGLRNATVRRLAVPDLTTTVLTLTLTGLAADSALAGGHNPRLGRRLAAVLAIGAGSAVGAGLVSLGGLALPLAVTGTCISSSLASMSRIRRQRRYQETRIAEEERGRQARFAMLPFAQQRRTIDHIRCSTPALPPVLFLSPML